MTNTRTPTRYRADQSGPRYWRTQETGQQDDPERAGQRAAMTATLIPGAEQRSWDNETPTRLTFVRKSSCAALQLPVNVCERDAH